MFKPYNRYRMEGIPLSYHPFNEADQEAMMNFSLDGQSLKNYMGNKDEYQEF